MSRISIASLAWVIAINLFTIGVSWGAASILGLNEGAWFNNPDLNEATNLQPTTVVNFGTVGDDNSWDLETITDIMQGIITIPALLYKFFSLDYPIWNDAATFGIPLRIFTGIVGFFFVGQIIYQIAPAMLNMSRDLISSAAGLFGRALPWR